MGVIYELDEKAIFSCLKMATEKDGKANHNLLMLKGLQSFFCHSCPVFYKNKTHLNRIKEKDKSASLFLIGIVLHLQHQN